MIQKHSFGSAILILVLVTVAVVVMLSMSMARMTQTAFNSMNTSAVMLQAQQYAAAEGDIVRYTVYNDLAAQSKMKITDTDFFKKISVGAESDYTDTIKQKIISVKIYKGSDVLPCYKLEVPRLSADVSDAKGVPIGTVITWASNNAPTENGVWLECNGQSCAAYPKLVAVLGKNTVPDYRGRFLEGAATAGTVKEAGLPNIIGEIHSDPGDATSDNTSVEPFDSAESGKITGAFIKGPVKPYQLNLMSYDIKNYNYTLEYIGFDASRCSSVYGNSDTVQPSSVTVRYLIRAA